jgi:hypothetical protein
MIHYWNNDFSIGLLNSSDSGIFVFHSNTSYATYEMSHFSLMQKNVYIYILSFSVKFLFQPIYTECAN